MPNFNNPTQGMGDHDVHRLKSLVPEVEGIKIVEIGSWTGKSTCTLAEIARRKNGKVYAIDTFDGRGSSLFYYAGGIRRLLEVNLQVLKLTDYVEILEGVSDSFVDRFEDDSLDFVFIDGDHRYNQVKKDIVNWRKKVKKGGILAGHDFDGDEYDEQYINDDFKDGKHHGVIKAVLECVPDYQHVKNFWFVEI